VLSKIRLLIAQVFRFLPISSEVLGPPKGIYSISEWLKKYKTQVNGVKSSYFELALNVQEFEEKPKSIDDKIHWKFEKFYADFSPIDKVYFVTIPDGRVWSDSAIITADDRLLKELSMLPRKIIEDHPIFSKLKLRSVYHIEGTAAVLSARSGDNYYHWMFDVLPRLELITLGGRSISLIDKFIINSSRFRFQIETLTHLSIPQEKLVEIEKYSHIKADQLLVPSLRTTTNDKIGSKFACNFLRREFMPKMKESLNTSERIYISRSKAQYRRILNEEQVTDVLDKLGFVPISLESISIFEQVSIFSSAKVIISPHGAGLTNTVFCREGTKLIEIFSPNYLHVCYWSICNYVGIEYYYLIGEGQRPPEYVHIPKPFPYRDNIIVNINALLSLMSLADIK
jgi:hypothetical protein